VKELVIISGKGGTGKTCITASFGYLADKKVLADCDVDAADLHIILQPDVLEKEEFWGGVKAKIDPCKCIKCGLCVDVCRYEAIGASLKIDGYSCEGCSVCFHVCPEKAISMEESLNGHWFKSESRFGPMVHAVLLPGEENSGKLVALVRNQARALADRLGIGLVLVDGAPGVGCPVISSVTGANHVLVVTEPSLSGLHDMQRAVKLVQNFKIPVTAVINKYDINLEITAMIERWLEEKGIGLSGRIPYDTTVIRAMVKRKSVVEDDSGPANEAIRSIWEHLRHDVLMRESQRAS
jgi:MinD superfamily P-loop ATPase